jgi:Outer membrane protein beta-barrel domain
MRLLPRLIVAVFLGCAALPLAAQRPPSRPGMWLGGGAGLGWARVGCNVSGGQSVCGENRGHSLTAHAEAGGRISDQVLIGGEIQGWFRNGTPGTDRPADELMLTYSMIAYWYPSARYPYYLKGGVGLATYRIDDGTDRVTASALGPEIGVGWEAPIAGHFSVIPYVNAMFASIGGALKFDGDPVLDHSRLALIQFGVGLARR